MTASPSTVSPEAPLTLKRAAELAFPDGTVNVRTLRGERDKGTLATFLIGAREYTTLADIAAMVERCKCRDRQNRRGSSSGRPDETAPPGGSSSQTDAEQAQAAAKESLNELRNSSQNGSAKNATRGRAKVIPIRS